jgi:hypothetical protein
MPRRDGDVFLFGTAMGVKLLQIGNVGFESGLIEDDLRQG